MMFSLITVTRNNLFGLKKTAASIREQTSRDYEWRVIDGASNDGTVKWLETIDALWLSEPDSGIYDAMNKGSARAQGDYILFMNAGDEFSAPKTLANLEEFIRNQKIPPDLVYGDALEERPDQAVPAYKRARSHKKIGNGLFTHHQAILYRRKILNNLRYDTGYPLAADYKFTAQALNRAETVLYWPHPVCLFEAGGVSQKNIKQARREQAEIRRNLGICGPLKNRIISVKQRAASALKRISPGLFWFLRSRF